METSFLDRVQGSLEQLGSDLARLVEWLTAALDGTIAWVVVRLAALGVEAWAAALLLGIVLMAIALVLVVRWRRPQRQLPRLPGVSPVAPLAFAVRRPTLLGYAALLLFFGGFGAWAAYSPLASAAVSPGVVSPDGSRKTIAHLEGGIVRAIGVREGDFVRQGQMLVMLEDVGARSEFEALRERFLHLTTLEARLQAELAEDATLALPPALAGYPEAVVRPALLAQQRLLQSRRATLAGREQVLGQRILQLEAEIEGLRQVIIAQDEQIALIGEEIATVQELLNKGLGNKPRLLALQRQGAEIRAAQAASRARIARHEQEIGEARLQLLTMHEEVRERVAEEISRVRTELASVQSVLPSREDVLARTVVTAPLDGTVVDLKVTTQTGVVRAGEPLLDLVPIEANLIVDARVKPTDMDTVRAGQTARVVFSAYGQRNLPQIEGRLRSISADRFVDERTGEPYFLAKVEVDPDELLRIAPEIELTPGMPAEVMILTGERTLLDYLLRPFIQSVMRSFRES